MAAKGGLTPRDLDVWSESLDQFGKLTSLMNSLVSFMMLYNETLLGVKFDKIYR